MSDAVLFDPSQVSAEEFARLVGVASDEQLGTAIRAIGTARVLDRIFQQMQERFLPERAAGVEAEVQFVIRDDEEEHPYRVGIGAGGCTVQRGQATRPRVTLNVQLVSFAKLVTGWAEGPALFMSGRLTVSGDIGLALRLLGFFDRPKVV
jgi:putative sterol carrier protein